jgi:hypothetical protein
MENIKIKIEVISNDKSATSTVDLKSYELTKEMHGINILDEIVAQLLSEIVKNK